MVVDSNIDGTISPNMRFPSGCKFNRSWTLILSERFLNPIMRYIPTSNRHFGLIIADPGNGQYPEPELKPPPTCKTY